MEVYVLCMCRMCFWIDVLLVVVVFRSQLGPWRLSLRVCLKLVFPPQCARQQHSKCPVSLERKMTFPRCGTHGPFSLPDAFTEVKVIDDLVAQLLKEKDDEIKHKEFYVEEFNSKQLKLKIWSSQ